LVLTFNIGPKANSNASTHTNYLISLLKNEVKKGSDPFFDLTHNYTGEPGPLNSPRLPVCLDFWGLTEGHRSPSERGIIAAKPARSTTYLQSCEPFRPHRCTGLPAGQVRAAEQPLIQEFPAAPGLPGARVADHFSCFSACHCLYWDDLTKLPYIELLSNRSVSIDFSNWSSRDFAVMTANE